MPNYGAVPNLLAQRALMSNPHRATLCSPFDMRPISGSNPSVQSQSPPS